MIPCGRVVVDERSTRADRTPVETRPASNDERAEALGSRSLETSNVTPIRLFAPAPDVIFRWSIMVMFAPPALALLAGAIAASSAAAPTGSPFIDTLLIVVAIGALTWAAAWLPWWAVAAAVAVATTFAFAWPLVAVGVVVFVAVLGLAATDRMTPIVQVAAMAVALNLMIRSAFAPFFGASAIVGIALAVFVAGVWFWSSEGSVRRSVAFAGGVLAAVTLLAVSVFAVAAWSASSSLREGNELGRAGLWQLANGDTGRARASFDEASSSLSDASATLERPWVRMVAGVPVLAQNDRAVRQLVADTSNSTATIADLLAEFDLDAVRVLDGRIDVVAVSGLQAPFADLRRTVDELGEAVSGIDDPWVAGPVRRRIDGLLDDIAEQQSRGDNVAAVLDRAPALLGAEEPRVYLVAFTTPVEARGHGGFFGNFAELEIDDGSITFREFGRNTDLNEGGQRPRVVSGPEDWLERYGRFGFTSGPGGAVGEQPWMNITMSPHFPSTGAVMAELYSQSGGRDVDGVFAVDVETVAALLQFTGPIWVDGADEPLTSDNAAQFLLFDQYLPDDTEERVDMLETTARATIDRLLRGSMPGPAALGRTFGPMADEGRVAAYASRSDEQALFERLGVTGSLPEPAGHDVLVIALNNTAGNKIDNFLDVDLDYVVDPDAASGGIEARLRMTMTNSAPASGLPQYVIGNQVGLPAGTNRTWVSVYTVMAVTDARLDDVSQPVEVVREHGLLANAVLVELPPGSTRDVEFDLAGPVGAHDRGYRLELRTPPAVRPFSTSVRIVSDDGSEIVERVERSGSVTIDTERGG